MSEETIHLVAYDPNWPEKFNKEKQLIEETLGAWIDGGINHVGSTSIRGMISKPIIDIMVGVKDLNKAKACIPLLETIGYCYAPYKSDVMHWFCKPSPEHREYHLYLIEQTSYEWKARLAFRDYLRSHTDIAKEYVDLKQSLAAKYSNDRGAYTKAKEDFVEKVSAKALPET